jgi:hypothetical protein
MTYYLKLTLLLLLPLTLHAQDVKLINSTQQSWSGGIAGRRGSNYTFSISFSNYKSEPVPDTIWIGQHPVPLIPGQNCKHTVANTRSHHKKPIITFDISAGVSHDDYADRYPHDPSDPTGQKKAQAEHARIPYEGVALLSYQYKGKQYFYTIPRIITNYPPVNYP